MFGVRCLLQFIFIPEIHFYSGICCTADHRRRRSRSLTAGLCVLENSGEFTVLFHRQCRRGALRIIWKWGGNDYEVMYRWSCISQLPGNVLPRKNSPLSPENRVSLQKRSMPWRSRFIYRFVFNHSSVMLEILGPHMQRNLDIHMPAYMINISILRSDDCILFAQAPVMF